MPVLELDNICIQYGGVKALDRLTLRVEVGEIHGLIGPNGAGKTTAINTVSGLCSPSSGTLLLHDQSFKPRTRKLAKAGIARTFQAPSTFESLNTIENVMVGGYSWTRSGLLSGMLRLPRALDEERRLRARAGELLDRIGLPFPHTTPIVALPVGARRQVELARALMSDPRLLLLDEPTGGLTQAEVDGLGRLLREIRDEASGRLAVLLVEHNVPFVLSLCDSVTAMDSGRDIAHGTPIEVRQNGAVIHSYLGAGIAARPVQRIKTVPKPGSTDRLGWRGVGGFSGILLGRAGVIR